ncbi:Pyruvate kinase [Neorhizobium galegae bv. officinalis bv. officinalis str. HAMBI 1141]|uniref:Pyruvate kinase n=1 Tax=Neorhizobium galegae bv. officinalis bv. officinalis str. HAMBI 1141 TaxID=1028801 RepID=A0A068TB79_NEOGA|nr:MULTISPECIES: pyruvate kinase [Neorhizobium]MCJ9674044.1 pyruvate kinase [Neorhizobium sp. SHOUNA12B]MCJ9746622.1 pyruvate kinase [Neorhizobium sp. SHOUNA12A]MCJ9754740.1 pyruvate kinase [Neorhizobium sp. BETTINA12A]CDN55316.1 Pyruvate kinase [Neorhizobium galegae bv. officinalis bv. officinalis str. HAMBI 1141]
MRRNRKVKILATLGPASSEEEMIQKLHEAGADLFRINMSHASHDLMRTLIKRIRSVEERSGRPIGILADLQGPKLRVGKFAAGKVTLTPGQTFTLDSRDEPGDETRVFLPHPEILESVKVGHRLLIDDGKLALKAEKSDGKSIVCKVVAGTSISDRKGVSLPDTLLGVGALTEKDRIDLDAVLATDDVDWVALSFVQRPDDLAEVRKIARGRVGIMSKIEKPQALERIDEIIELSDAVMVARGDLGVEMPIEAVPGIQKQLTRLCRRAGKPVVVATQMLESMITAPVPTRAEVSDVSIAVFEGADAIMLSAESASGQYPVEAVSMMASIASTVEQDPLYPSIIYAQRATPEATGADAISLAARQIAETLKLAAIVTYTSSGTTGLRASRERPQVPIIALSPIVQTARRLSVGWGMHCVVTSDATDLDDMVNRACRIVVSEGFGKPGDRIIISAGVPLGTPGATNMLRIAYIGSDGQSGI